MRNPLAEHAPWKQLLAVSVALPVVVVAAVLAFAWPAARIQPRDLPVGVVATSPAGEQVIAGLDAAEPGGFDFHLYADRGTALAAIENRDVYGAFVVTPQRLTVLEASAASPTVAQLLTTTAENLVTAQPKIAGNSVHAATTSPSAEVPVIRDVVGLSAADPRGTVFGSALLPLTICSILIASVLGIVVRFRPAWRQVAALMTVSAIVAAGVYLITQSWLGALPHQAAASWAAVALTVLAIASATGGLIALAGPLGFGIAAAVMVFVGNPFSGISSAPELLPDAVRNIGTLLPPGAGANLLRSTAYFDGNGATGHVTVLVVWIVLGFAAIVVGHHAPIRFAANAVPVRAVAGRGSEEDENWQPRPAASHGAVRHHAHRKILWGERETN